LKRWWGQVRRRETGETENDELETGGGRGGGGKKHRPTLLREKTRPMRQEEEKTQKAPST